MALILHSKTVKEIPISSGYKVEIYEKKDDKEIGKCPEPGKIISMNINVRTVHGFSSQKWA